MSTIVADTLLMEGSSSSSDSSSFSEGSMTVGEYLLKETDVLTKCVLFICGAYHINIQWNKLTAPHSLILLWRLALILSTIAFLCNEMELLMSLPFELRDVLIRLSIFLQCLILIPTIFNTSHRFRCQISKTQAGVMSFAMRTFSQFFVCGFLMSLLYGYCVFFYGVYYLSGPQLAFEAIGFACISLLVTWAILFVVLDVSVTHSEIGGLKELAKRRALTSAIYKRSHGSSYQLVNTNSVSVCNAAAFCAYFNLFTFIIYIITIPPTESVLLTLGFCTAILFKEASFIFFIFPFFAKVNGGYAELIDMLAEDMWHHSNGVDTSCSLCLLTIRRPLSLSILGRVATMNEMYGQLSGLVLLSLTTFIRVLEVNNGSYGTK